MAKTGPIGKAESFYIQEKYKSGISIEEISKDLDRAKNSIENYIKKNKIDTPRSIVDQQFARQNGATIMTENASSMIDQKKSSSKKPQSSCITKIR